MKEATLAATAAAGVPAASQEEVVHDEASEVQRRRHGHEQLDDLMGLAFSGGGIRSATFNLGIIQGLAKHGYLHGIDYLSTVSGGGYIGGWLAAWIKREGFNHVQTKLANNEDDRPTTQPWRYVEPNPVRFLRKYSNYLAPRAGLTSTDTWALLSIYFRNVLLNLTLLIASGTMFLLMPLAVMSYGGHLSINHLSLESKAWSTTMLCLLIAMGAIAYSFASFSRDVARQWGLGRSVVKRPGWYVLLPMLLAAICLTYILARNPQSSLQYWTKVGGIVYAAIFIGGNSISSIIEAVSQWNWRALFGAGTGPQPISRSFSWPFLSALIAGAFGGVLLYLIHAALMSFPNVGSKQPQMYSDMAARIVLGPPLLLLSFVLVSILHIGLLGRSFPDARREWLARLSGMLSLAAGTWFVAFGIAIYGPVLFKFFFLSSWAHTTWGRVLQAIVATGWVGTTLAGVVVGNRSNSTPPMRGNGTAVLLNFAPPVFILGLALLLSAGLDASLAKRIQAPPTPQLQPTFGQYRDMVRNAGTTTNAAAFAQQFSKLVAAVTPESARTALREISDRHWNIAAKYLDWNHRTLWILLAALFAAGRLMAWRLDVNEFSIHLLYRNRLVRCYLGASRGRDRKPQTFTGFDVDDDIPLATLTTQNRTGSIGDNPPGSEKSERAYEGPYPLLCAALNLVSGKDLAWQTRKARSFIYSPLYCGYDYFPPEGVSSRLGEQAYRDTGFFSGTGGPYLGTAMAVSGAAASPNMGYHSSPALTFLMGIFNVRLGWWVGNPRHRNTWMTPGPRSALYLAMELFGRTDDENRFVYLSDGGHFENLGLYELVRRKCRYIIACDASCDPRMTFSDFGNAIDKCRRDLGAHIEIDVSRIRLRSGERISRAHYAFGSIRYDDLSRGSLLYIKSSRTGNERVDVQAYATEHEAFPHDTTAEQFFNETRFESYRALGEDAFDSIVQDIARAITEHGVTGPTTPPPRTGGPADVSVFFRALEQMRDAAIPVVRAGSIDMEEVPFGKMKLTFEAL